MACLTISHAVLLDSRLDESRLRYSSSRVRPTDAAAGAVSLEVGDKDALVPSVDVGFDDGM
jgi:hypothetical protein